MPVVARSVGGSQTRPAEAEQSAHIRGWKFSVHDRTSEPRDEERNERRRNGAWAPTQPTVSIRERSSSFAGALYQSKILGWVVPRGPCETGSAMNHTISEGIKPCPGLCDNALHRSISARECCVAQKAHSTKKF